jgi:hydroxylysine kinase
MEDMAAVIRVSPAHAAEIARRHYGVTGTAERLAAEHDDTFRLVTADGTARLLKISVVPAGSLTHSRGHASLQTAVLAYLAAASPELPVQRVIPTVDGRPEVLLDEGPIRVARMTSWLDGQLLGPATTSATLRRDIGATLARLSITLRGFRHPGARRTHPWDLQNFGRLRPLLYELPASGQAPSLRAALDECLDHFDAVVAPRLETAATQVIHTDFHGENLLTDGGRVTGILDFGDALTGPVAMDVGVAACYQLGATGPGRGGAADGPDLLGPALDVVRGYHSIDPLDGGELDLVAEFLLARVAARIIVSQANAARDPANSGYLLRRTSQAIDHFGALRLLPPDLLSRRLRAACGLEERS